MPGGGGAISVQNGALSLSNSLLDGNRVTLGNGGAVACSRCQLAVRSSTVQNNTAGGGSVDLSGSPDEDSSQGGCADLAAAATSDGGGLWLGDGAAAVVEGSALLANECGGSGGAVAVSFSSLSIVSATIRANVASRAGGVFAVSGGPATSLSVRSAAVAANRATAGGFLAFIGRSDLPSVNLSRVSLSDSSASIGGIYAALGMATAFVEPRCEACDISQPVLARSGYGFRTATAPVTAVVSAGIVVRAGQPAGVSVVLLDAFNQAVPEFSLVATVSCFAFQPRIRSSSSTRAPCETGAVRGTAGEIVQYRCDKPRLATCAISSIEMTVTYLIVVEEAVDIVC